MTAPLRKRTDYFRDYARERAAERRAFNAANVPVPEKSSASGPDYLALADAIVGHGKPYDAFTAAERKQSLALAIGWLRERGEWPEQQKRNPDVACPQGHQHRPQKKCQDCQRIEERRQARERKRAQIARERRSAA